MFNLWTFLFTSQKKSNILDSPGCLALNHEQDVTDSQLRPLKSSGSPEGIAYFCTYWRYRGCQRNRPKVATNLHAVEVLIRSQHSNSCGHMISYLTPAIFCNPPSSFCSGLLSNTANGLSEKRHLSDEQGPMERRPPAKRMLQTTIHGTTGSSYQEALGKLHQFSDSTKVTCHDL